MDHPTPEYVSEGNEASVGMGWKSFGEDDFLLKGAEGVEFCEGVYMVD